MSAEFSVPADALSRQRMLTKLLTAPLTGSSADRRAANVQPIQAATPVQTDDELARKDPLAGLSGSGSSGHSQR